MAWPGIPLGLLREKRMRPKSTDQDLFGSFRVPLGRITHARRFGLTPKKAGLADVVALLNNAEFCRDARAFHDAMGPLVVRKDWPETVAAQEIPRFYDKWGVLPPPKPLVDSRDPKAILAESRDKCILGSGRWGLIPVFPWTTWAEVKAARRRIQRKIGKEHGDVEAERRRVEIAAWLNQHTDAKRQPIPWAEICRVVWERKTGLRRPTKAHAIARLSEDEETALLREYMNRGLPRGEAGRRVYRRARGSEAKASAQARKAVSRLSQATREILRDVRAPRELDAIGYALTMLFRAALVTRDSAEARRWLTTLHQTLTNT